MRLERRSKGRPTSSGRKMAMGSAGIPPPGRGRKAPSTASHHTTASQAVKAAAMTSHTLTRIEASKSVRARPSQSPVRMTVWMTARVTTDRAPVAWIRGSTTMKPNQSSVKATENRNQPIAPRCAAGRALERVAAMVQTSNRC
jgi:hypothetical protein